MTEKEKMLSGKLYDSTIKELFLERTKCKSMCYKFNNLPPENLKDRQDLLAKILGKSDSTTYIEQTFLCDYGYNIEVGKNFYANHNLVVLDCAKVKIGENVFIAPNCSIYTASHPLVAKERNELLEYALPITIGNNVWIGGNVTILPNVKIGDNVVIGAGSVVTKDIPDNFLAYGNPCKPIRKITDKDKMKQN